MVAHILVNSERGTRNEHYFYKIVMLPQYTPGFGKKGCAKLGWRWVGEFHARKTTQTLDYILADYLEEYNEYSSDIHHVHIGLKMDQLHASPQQRHTTSGGSTTDD